MAKTPTLEEQAYEAGGKAVHTIFGLHGKERGPEIFHGYMRAYADAYAALVGPTVAAEALYRLADAQAVSVSLDTQNPAIAAALAKVAKDARSG